MIETLIKPLADALGVSVPAARKFWKDVASEARDAADAEAAKASAEERERIWREINERRQRETAEEHERLWSSCKEIAESPTLLADMEKIARRLGLVGEGASLRGAYLTASSRLNKESAICLLRRGAPAGGKNFLIDKTFALIPDDCVVRMSSGSPLSLVYYGGEDEDALKHKIVYVPEAAVIAEKNRVESPLTIMLRILISEGRLDHNVALPQADGPPETVHIKRNGPVVVIITSARDNVEDELLTRLMTSDADESPEQTLAVLSERPVGRGPRRERSGDRAMARLPALARDRGALRGRHPVPPGDPEGFQRALERDEEARRKSENSAQASPRRARHADGDQDVGDIAQGPARERRERAHHCDDRRLSARL